MGRRRRNKKSLKAKTTNDSRRTKPKASSNKRNDDRFFDQDQVVPSSSRESESPEVDHDRLELELPPTRRNPRRNKNPRYRLFYETYSPQQFIRSPVCTRSRQRLLNEGFSVFAINDHSSSSSGYSECREPRRIIRTAAQVRQDNAYKKSAMKRKKAKPYPKPIKPQKKKPNRRPKPPSHYDDNVYIIECVLKTRKRCGVHEYFVKWQGYDSSHNSWVLDRDIMGSPPNITDTDSNATEVAAASELNADAADVRFDSDVHASSIMDEEYDANARVNPVASTSLSSNRILSNEPFLTPTTVGKTKSTTISLKKGPQSLPPKRVDESQRIQKPGGSCCCNGATVPPKNGSRPCNIVTAYLNQKNSASKFKRTTIVTTDGTERENNASTLAVKCRASTSSVCRSKEPALRMNPPVLETFQEPLHDCHVHLNDLQGEPGASTSNPSPIAIPDRVTSPIILPIISIPPPPASSSSFISTTQGYNPCLQPERISDLAIYRGRRFLQIKWVGVSKRRWVLDSIVKRNHPELVFQFYERERDRLLDILKRLGHPQTSANTTTTNPFPELILPN